MKPDGRTAIILVNYNGHVDTISCLMSLLRLDSSDFDVFVVDNASPDGGGDEIFNWGNEQEGFNFSYVDYRDDLNLERLHAEAVGMRESSSPRCVLVRSSRNGGFAYGNNVGIKVAERFYAYEYYWILNNDTEVELDSLSQMISTMSSKSDIGAVGSTLRYFNNRDKVQTYGGGVFNKWFAKVTEIKDTAWSGGLDYCTGASMLVKRRFVEEVGFMDERYFLYCEELDWAIRGRISGFTIAHANGSVVYHKEGASIGTDTTNVTNRSDISDFYGVRARILLTKKFYPQCLPTVYMSMLVVILNRFRRKQYRRAWRVLLLMLNPEMRYV